MVDFSKIFNIVFVSVCAALLLFLLVSAIVVAAKGKRKCSAFDIALRVLSSFVLIVSAAMLACSVLTMLKGSVCIVVADGKTTAAALVMSGSVTELPLPDLFVALSTVIGFGLSAVLFILSLTALIVDCLVANKKTDKKKEPAVKKSPEQLKREAELERIRRIGESAVRKTNSVASAEKSEPAAASEPDSAPQKQSAGSVADEQEETVDWREEQPKQEQPTSFVGLKDEQSDFDSFDTFDSNESQPEAEAESEDGFAEQADYTAEQTVDEVVDQAEEDIVDQAYEAAEQADEYAEQDEYEAAEATEQTDEAADEIYYDDDEQYTYDESAEGGEEAYEQADIDEASEGEADNADYAQEDEQYDEDMTDGGDYVDEQADYEASDEPTGEYDEVADQADDEPAPQADEPDKKGDDEIEPDRGIYIPEIRTVTPRPVEKPAPVAAKKPPAAKKPAAKKPVKPKKDGGASQKPVDTTIPPEKKLPVTRRYVILDRHNAVNMFGEYLKERNQAEKDKLKSSINTIIIE